MSLVRSFLAVMVGFGMMRIASLLLSLLLAGVLGRSAPADAAHLLLNAVVSIVCVLLGGLVCGFMAATRPVLHGAVLAALIFLLQALAYLSYKGPQPFWYQLFMQAVPPCFAVAGAWLFAHGARAKPR